MKLKMVSGNIILIMFSVLLFAGSTCTVFAETDENMTVGMVSESASDSQRTEAVQAYLNYLQSEPVNNFNIVDLGGEIPVLLVNGNHLQFDDPIQNLAVNSVQILSYVPDSGTIVDLGSVSGVGSGDAIYYSGESLVVAGGLNVHMQTEIQVYDAECVCYGVYDDAYGDELTWQAVSYCGTLPPEQEDIQPEGYVGEEGYRAIVDKKENGYLVVYDNTEENRNIFAESSVDSRGLDVGKWQNEIDSIYAEMDAAQNAMSQVELNTIFGQTCSHAETVYAELTSEIRSFISAEEMASFESQETEWQQALQNALDNTFQEYYGGSAMGMAVNEIETRETAAHCQELLDKYGHQSALSESVSNSESDVLMTYLKEKILPVKGVANAQAEVLIQEKKLEDGGTTYAYQVQNGAPGVLTYCIEDLDGDGRQEMLVFTLESKGEENYFGFETEVWELYVSAYSCNDGNVRDSGIPKYLDTVFCVPQEHRRVFLKKINSGCELGYYAYNYGAPLADGVGICFITFEWNGSELEERIRLESEGSSIPEEEIDTWISAFQQAGMQNIIRNDYIFPELGEEEPDSLDILKIDLVIDFFTQVYSWEEFQNALQSGETKLEGEIYRLNSVDDME